MSKRLEDLPPLSHVAKHSPTSSPTSPHNPDHPSRKFPSPRSGHKQITLARSFKSLSSLENAYKNLKKSKSYAHYSLFKAEFAILNHFFNRILPKISFPKGKIDLKSTKFGPVVHIKIKNRLNYMHFHTKMIMKLFF